MAEGTLEHKHVNTLASEHTPYLLQHAHNPAVFESRLREQSVAVPLMCCAAHMLCVPSRKQLVIVGNKSAKEFLVMVTEVHATYDPNKTVIQVDPSSKEMFWEEKPPKRRHYCRE